MLLARGEMVDIFALALSHGLLALVAIRLLSRPELDDEGADRTRPKTGARHAAPRAMKLPEGTGHDA